MHIIAVGAVYIDTILSVPHYPDEDQKLRATSLTRRRGGNCANTLEVLEQLIQENTSKTNKDVHLTLLSVLPAEASNAVKFVRDSFRGKVALDPSCIYREYHHEAASSYIIKSASSGTRTIVNYNELPEMTVDEFIAKASIVRREKRAECGWFHFEGRIPDILLLCIRHLCASPDYSDFKISVEVEKPGREGLTEVAAEADVVFYSRSWAEGQGYTSAQDCLENQILRTKHDALLCCTWGSAGAAALQKSPDGMNTWASVDAWRPASGSDHIVDTIGAGDTFIAGILHGLTSYPEWTVEKKLRLANELAGRKVLQEGFESLLGQS